MAIRSAIKSLLVSKYSKEIEYNIPIRTSVNTGGVKLNLELEQNLA